MRNFESYHIIGFLLAYLSLNNKYLVQIPKVSITDTVYTLISVAPMVAVLTTTNSQSFEHSLLVLSIIFTERSLSSLITIDNNNSTKVKLTNYLHMIFIISLLLLVYNQKVNIPIGYAIMVGFSMLSLMSNKTSIPFALQDFLIIHLLFFFTK
jgi:hypothetical protein